MKTGKGDNRRSRVVVVGVAIAGLSAVRELSGADVDVLLLDRNLYNTFQPLLYQVAAGGLNPGDITYRFGRPPPATATRGSAVRA